VSEAIWYGFGFERGGRVRAIVGVALHRLLILFAMHRGASSTRAVRETRVSKKGGLFWRRATVAQTIPRAVSDVAAPLSCRAGTNSLKIDCARRTS
jgi:hypothetical protein